jgi:Trypsin-like peptidase domain
MRKVLGLVLSFLLASMPVFAAQEVDRTKMSKSHQRAYDAALALYGTYQGTTHFLCSTTVVASRETARQEANTGKYEYLLLTAGHCITGDGLPQGLQFGVREDIAPESPKPELIPAMVVKAENTVKYDFAVLDIVTDKVFPVIDIDFNYVPAPEDKVYDVNFSIGIAKQVALGTVATKVMGDGSAPERCDICKGRYMVHIFAGPGASGSSVISEKTGKIIGVGEFGFPGDTLGLGVETTFAFNQWLVTAKNETESPKGQSPQSVRLETR